MAGLEGPQTGWDALALAGWWLAASCRLQQHLVGTAGNAAATPGKGRVQLLPALLPSASPRGGQNVSPGGQAGGLPLPGGPRLLSEQLCCCPSAGISLIMWNALYTAEKVIIRWTLLTEACYFAVQFLGE